MLKDQKDLALYAEIRDAIREDTARLPLVINAINDGLNDKIDQLTSDLANTQLALSVSLARSNNKAQTKEIINSLLVGTKLEGKFK